MEEEKTKKEKKEKKRVDLIDEKEVYVGLKNSSYSFFVSSFSFASSSSSSSSSFSFDPLWQELSKLRVSTKVLKLLINNSLLPKPLVRVHQLQVVSRNLIVIVLVP
jgi:hypothetical protein